LQGAVIPAETFDDHGLGVPHDFETEEGEDDDGNDENNQDRLEKIEHGLARVDTK
jgi:hypothetical protein